MAIRKERVLSFVYQKVSRMELRLIDLGLIGPTTKFQLTYNGRSENAYTTIAGKDADIFRVVIGGRMVANTAHLPDTFTSKSSLKPFIGPIKMAFKGLNYHEMGHVLFTDMTLRKIKEYDERYLGFVMNLFNVLEDPIIELNIIKHVEKTKPYDKSPKIYIDFLKKQLFFPKCEEYQDKEDLQSFMQYLLLALRCGKDKIKGTNKVYDKYSKDIVPMIKEVLSEPDATERQVKTIVLADWIIKNIEEFDWTSMSAPDDLRPAPSSSSSHPLRSSVSSGEASDMAEGKKGGSGGSGGKSEGAEDKDKGKSAEEEEEKEEDEGKTEEDEEMPDTGEDDYVPDIDECFEDLINCSYDHEFVIAKDEYTIARPEELEEGLNDQLEKSKECVQNISKFLTLFKGRKKPRITSGFTSGKLNIPAAMQDEARDGCETKLFNRTVIRGQATDLAVSLVCDNSGSMSGTKSTLASIAALALAQACDWSKIPFEASCFTKTTDSPSGTSITIIEKELEEPFNKAKPYFAINDSSLIHNLKSERSIPTFCGNSEEVNLYHIGNNFARCKHTTKLMFVFCDGATTGSCDNLKKVVARMESQGIHVIGIGLQASEVAEIYPNHRIFNSLKEMQSDLAPYLVTTLSKFATK